MIDVNIHDMSSARAKHFDGSERPFRCVILAMKSEPSATATLYFPVTANVEVVASAINEALASDKQNGEAA